MKHSFYGDYMKKYIIYASGLTISLFTSILGAGTPIVSLPIETSVFTLPDSAPPDPTSRDYLNIEEKDTPNSNNFNGIQRPSLKNVTISAKTLILESKNLNQLYETYNNAKNIKNFTIYTETLIINSPLYLPSTNISIYAKNIDVGKNGSISVQPLDDSEEVGNTGYIGNNGKAGSDSGNFTMYIQKSMPFNANLNGGTVIRRSWYARKPS